MRTILFLLLLARLASAQTAATGIWAPTTAIQVDGISGFFDQADNVMWCNDFVPPIDMTSATSIVFPAGSGDLCGVAIYDCPANVCDSGTRLVNASGVVCSGVATVFSGLSPFNLTAGNLYRACWCFKLGSHGFYINPGGSENMADIQNAFVTHTGSAFNSCTLGVPPTTSGVLTPQTIPPASLWISKE